MSELVVLTGTTHADARGVILTFLPDESIVEYNLVTLRAGAVRGMHHHPLFTEYLLFTAGTGRLDWRCLAGEHAGRVAAGPGVSTRAVPGVAHAVRASTDMTFVAMLTRRWDDCDPPLVRADV